MGRISDMSKEELLAEMADRFDAEDLEDLSDWDLQMAKAWDEVDSMINGDFEAFNTSNPDVLRTKEQLLQSIEHQIKVYEEKAENSPADRAYNHCIARLLTQLNIKVEKATFPSKLEDWWYYTYCLYSTGIKLHLSHVEWDTDATTITIKTDQSFPLIEVPARLLTSAEYAAIYGVQPVTVRQWIRRGKLRNAVKLGKEWGISELAFPPKERGYTDAWYYWDGPLTDIPEKFDIPSDCSAAYFHQHKNNGNKFDVFFTVQEKMPKEEKFFTMDRNSFWLQEAKRITVTTEEREELELYMISNPLVKSRSGGILNDFFTIYEGDIEI